MALSDEELLEITGIPDREILVKILGELKDIRVAFNQNSELLSWMVENTKMLFSFVEQIQENGGPSAILGMLGRS